MILYFASRRMKLLGKASTNLRKSFVIKDDVKIEEVETGVSTFECRIGFDASQRTKLENMAAAGNYILIQREGESEFYTIIDSETDTKNCEVYVYAEDAGLDLINEISLPFEATEAHKAEWYINRELVDSGFEIGINEIPQHYDRKLKWSGECTVTERIASIATQFDNFEISYSFEVKGMEIVKKYVNIFKKRGKNTEETLRLNREIDRIVTKTSVANLATALRVTGGIPEESENPITLDGYVYDDGDMWLHNSILRSREAAKKWSRYVWNNEPNKLNGYAGHIIKTYSFDTLSQSELCNRAISELKKIRDAEVNYEIDISALPENVKIGDRVNIVDDDGELYLSSRILRLETSASNNTRKATVGEHLIKEGGISTKVAELAEKFADSIKTVSRAKTLANEAKKEASNAKSVANEALTDSKNAITKADNAASAAANAAQTAAAANSAASAAQTAVETVEKSVENIESTVSNAQKVAEEAKTASSAAQTKANEAATAASNAAANAETAVSTANEAKTAASEAVKDADGAMVTAVAAKTQANEATSTANAAKVDAQKASDDVKTLGSNLETLSQTMQADYARKTDLTETTASLQTQITQNAAEISSTASKVIEIDETANNAAELATSAQQAAELAQAKANDATADAEAAQAAADAATAAANAAQSEADTAKAAAATAQGVANKAESDLATAKADLATVKGRVDATEEEIATAQAAVDTAQAAANAAKADAATAAQKATSAQETANTAKENAVAAQTTANDAVNQATAAQLAAAEAKGNATAAQTTANEAKANAAAAQTTANTAKTNAATAQSKADEAAQAAAAAQADADAADAKAAQAASDLATAQSNLAAVTSRVGATEAEIAEAEKAVAAAQKAADDAASAASTAQSTANTAKTNAATAQTAANNAKTAADNAQKAADDAQDAADAAQEAVDSLAVRVTTAETKITQNSEQIALRATKAEVTSTLGGYYTKSETDAAITVKANAITSTVENTYQKTVSKGEQLITNGNGLMGDNTNFSTWTFDGAIANNSSGSFTKAAGSAGTYTTDEFFPVNPANEYTFSLDAKSSKGVGKLYSMLMFFDADKNQISAGNHIYNAASTTTLAKDLKAGDTVIYLTNSSGWSTTYSYGFYMIVWNYKNSFGYTYPSGTYSRTRLTLPKNGNYLNSANLNKTAHTITLASAYSGATIPAGTSVSQGGDGATYKYFPCSNTLVPTTWASYSGKISGVDYSGQNKANIFPPGTAYAKIGFLWNYQGSGNGEQLWITNLSVTDTTAVSQAQAAANAAQANVDALAQNVSSNYATKSEVTQTSNSITSSVEATYATKSALSATDTKAANAATAASNAQSTANTANSTANTAKTNAATAQTAADNAQKDIDALETNVANNYATKSEVTQTANSITSSVSATYATKDALTATDTKAANAATAASNAQSTANTANSTANTAKTNAAAAQSTADTAKANAATAQSTANTANSTANAAKTYTDNALNNYGYQYKYTITLNGDAAKYYPVIIHGGDQNVMREIMVKRSYNDKAPAEWAGHPSAYGIGLTLKIKCNFGGWGGANYSWQIIDLEEMYGNVFASAVHTFSNMGFAIFLRGGGTTGAVYTLYSDQPLEETRYGSVCPAVYYNAEQFAATGDYKWNAPAARTLTDAIKAEIAGKKFTYAANLTAAETRITQTENSITSQASSISSLGTRMSTVEQTANGLTVSLQTTNNNVATAQSTANSASSAASAAQSTANTANSTANTAKTNAATAQSTADTAKKIANAGAKKINTHMRSFTAALWQTYGAADHYESWTTGSSYDNTHINVGDIAYIVGKVSDAKGSNDVHATIYGTVNSVTTSAVVMTSLYYIMGGEGGAYALANTANTNAANAAKTATNYLNFSSSGLVIGDMTASTLGRNILIDSDSVDIRNGSTILASYQANKIQLGVNSTNSVIELCGGKGTISYGYETMTDENVLMIDSDFTVLTGDGAALITRTNPGVVGEVAGLVGTADGQIFMAVNTMTAKGADGEGVYTTNNLNLTSTDLYGIADNVEFVGRYGLTLQTVTGNVLITNSHLETSESIHANGGIIVPNNGSIFFKSTTGTDMRMITLNDANEMFFGYNGYASSLGKSYFDGNDVYIRSKNGVNITGAITASSSLTVGSNIILPNNTGLRWKDSGGTARSIMFLNNSNNIIIGKAMFDIGDGITNVYGYEQVGLWVNGETIALLPSTNSAYSAFFRPKTDGKCCLGVAANRWYAVYSANATIQTSDRRQKENIMPLGTMQLMDGAEEAVDMHSELFDRLQPVQYNFINGNKRTCYGLIAQDVIEALHEIGIGEHELDLVQHDFWPDEETGETTDSYGIAYSNLIALLIHEVQKLKKEVKSFKAS